MYHRYECQHGDLIAGLGCSALARLAYRSVSHHFCCVVPLLGLKELRRIVASQSLKFFNNIKHNLNVDENQTEIPSLALHYRYTALFCTSLSALTVSTAVSPV